MRILGLFLNDRPTTGGHKRYLELLRGLAERGHEVRLAVTARVGTAPVPTTASGLAPAAAPAPEDRFAELRAGGVTLIPLELDRAAAAGGAPATLGSDDFEPRGRPDHEQYAGWIDTYAGEDFSELTEWCKRLMDDVAADATESDRERYRELFRTSARYEYRFWDAAWRQEDWEL